MGKIAGSQPRITTLILASVAAAATNAILADTALDETEITEVTTFAAQPDVPRNLTVTGNAAAVKGDVVIEGVNAFGEVISETLSLNGTATVVGNKAFAQVLSVSLPPYDTADTERVRLGTGVKLGLDKLLKRNTVLAAFRNGARETTAPTVSVSPVAIDANTVALNSAPNGTDIIIDYYETI